MSKTFNRQAIYQREVGELEIYFTDNPNASYEYVTTGFYLYRDRDSSEVVGCAIENFDGKIVNLNGVHAPAGFEPTAGDERQRISLLYDQPVKKNTRPSWDDYFIKLAFMASTRSPDLSTKHGCVLVDPKHHRVLSMGYNGFKQGVDDHAKAREIPKPYDEIIHAERNSIDYCPFNLKFIDGVTAYVTGQCCLACTQYLIDNNVKHFVMAKRRGFSKWTEEDDAKFAKLIVDNGVIVRWVTSILDD